MLPGTGRWLLTTPDFLDWEGSSASEGFWLHGTPGCGKTNLATAVIQHLRDNPNAGTVAHFYCSREPAEPERSDATEILRSLVKQIALARGSDRISRVAVEAYERRTEQAGRNSEAATRLTSEECVQLACKICEQTPAAIVIDALEVLLLALKEISVNSRDLVKVFLSSRDDENISAHLRRGRTVQVTPERNKDDLVRFVHWRVDDFISKWSSVHANDDGPEGQARLREEIAQALIAGSQGMFLWAALQLKVLDDGDCIKTEEDIRLATHVMPESLSQSYDAIHERIGRMGQASRGITHCAFCWLLYTQRRLTVPEFLAAIGRTSVGLTSLASGLIVDCCCNLVVLDSEA